jgi:hypothetical protein
MSLTAHDGSVDNSSAAGDTCADVQDNVTSHDNNTSRR